MSHPYSGAASYIYANEYQTPTRAAHAVLTGYDSQPNEKLYNSYQYPGAPAKTVELNFQVQSAHPNFGLSDSTRAALGHRKRAKPPRQGAVVSPATTVATLAFSPASQVSSLPSRTTSVSHTSHSHSYSNAHHIHPRVYSHPQSQTHSHSRSSSRNNPNQTPQPPNPNHFNPPPTSNRPPQSHYYYATPSQHPDPINHAPSPPPKPKPPKLTVRTKFKLTLPNPFRQSSSSRSPWPPRSPTTHRRPGSPVPAAGTATAAAGMVVTVRGAKRSRPSSNFWDWSSSSSPKTKTSKLSKWLRNALGEKEKKKKKQKDLLESVVESYSWEPEHGVSSRGYPAVQYPTGDVNMDSRNAGW